MRRIEARINKTGMGKVKPPAGYPEPQAHWSEDRKWRGAAKAFASVLLLLCGACSQSYTPTASSKDVVNTYFDTGFLVLDFDHTASTFAEFTQGVFRSSPSAAGAFTQTSNGFLDIAVQATSNTPAQTNWAVEVPGVMGLFSNSQNSYPMVNNTTCPSYPKGQSFQFLSLGLTAQGAQTSAYGSVTVTTDGDAVAFTNIKQYAFPTSTIPAGTVIASPGPSSISGNCGASLYGNLVSITQFLPESGQSQNSQQTLQQTVDTLNMPSGFLLENANLQQNETVAPNVLGSTGAVGLATPNSAVSVSSAIGLSYRGFFASGLLPGSASQSESLAAGFGGSSSAGTACSAFQTALAALPTPPSANIIYGGDYPSNDPSANSTSNCDVAIDLGQQDSNNNGLFTGATIYLSSSFSGNTSGRPVSFPAIGIVGQINSQGVIFVESNTSLNSGTPLQIFLLQGGS